MTPGLDKLSNIVSMCCNGEVDNHTVIIFTFADKEAIMRRT